MHVLFKINNITKNKSSVNDEKVFIGNGIIGRGVACDWFIDDNKKIVSNQHAKIELIENDFFITDISSNGTYIHGNKLVKGARTLLKTGDIIKIGHFTIDVTIIDENAKEEKFNPRLFKLFLRRFNIEDTELLSLTAAKNVIEIAGQVLAECVAGALKITQQRNLNIFKNFKDPTKLTSELFSKMNESDFQDAIIAFKEIFESEVIPHSEAVSSAWLAALHRVMENLNPTLIEEKVEKNMFRKIMSDKHKAQCWDLLKEEFQIIASAAAKGALVSTFVDATAISPQKQLYTPPVLKK
ncbi:MAG: FHA domain-containing protein [Bdellovibrionota bacterium]